MYESLQVGHPTRDTQKNGCTLLCPKTLKINTFTVQRDVSGLLFYLLSLMTAMRPPSTMPLGVATGVTCANTTYLALLQAKSHTTILSIRQSN